MAYSIAGSLRCRVLPSVNVTVILPLIAHPPLSAWPTATLSRAAGAITSLVHYAVNGFGIAHSVGYARSRHVLAVQQRRILPETCAQCG